MYLKLIFDSFKRFSHLPLLMVSRWSLSDIKSPQVSRTLLSTQADLYNDVVRIVSTRSLISKSSRLCTNPLLTVRSTTNTIGITVNFMFRRFFFLFSSKVKVLVCIFVFFQFCPLVSLNDTIFYLADSIFGCLSLGLVVWLRLGDLFVSQNPREHCASHFPDGFLLVHLPFILMVKFKLLA